MLHGKLSFGALAAVSCLGLFVVAGPTSAADLDPALVDAPQVLPQSNVVFGSGWYVRGDIGATESPQITPSQPNFNTEDPSSIPLAPNLTTNSSSHLGYVGSLGAGYEFNRWFRADLIADFHQPISTNISGQGLKCPGVFVQNQNGTYSQGLEGCQPHYQASLHSYDVLLNGYVDLGTWYRVTPYIGAGVGMSFGHYQTSATYTQTDGTPYNIYVTNPTTGAVTHGDYDSSASGNYYNLAYALMAGISIDVVDHVKLDVGYRYLNQGKILSTNIQTQEARVGLRYMIDNYYSI